jgi:hypothetical protein
LSTVHDPQFAGSSTSKMSASPLAVSGTLASTGRAGTSSPLPETQPTISKTAQSARPTDQECTLAVRTRRARAFSGVTMRIRKPFVQFFAAALLVVTACGPKYRYQPNPPGPDPTMHARGAIDIGSPVAAKWSDGKWYFGHVSDIDGSRYAVDYADGDKGTVGAGEILPISRPEQIVPGAHVLAVWKGATMYPGVVLSVTNGHARVRWDDGDLPLDVPFDRIAVIGSVDAAPAPAAIAVGMRVAAKWTDGNWWYGAIGQVESDGYVINYADGDVLKVAPTDVVPVVTPGVLHVGDHVLAVWKGARMYPGVITAVHQSSATVRWDDGSAPLEISFEQIALH